MKAAPLEKPSSVCYYHSYSLTLSEPKRKVILSQSGNCCPLPYTYDYENRLARVIATASGATREAIYKYDYLGRRIQKDTTQFAVRRSQYYIYDGDNIIAEYDGSGTLIARYIYGPNIDEPIRLENSSGVCYYHFDALGSVTDLSNGSGQQVEHYTYSPFGKTKIYDPATGLKREDSIVGNFYRFTARQWDSESQLYFYRARYYDPNLGRFLQADPVGYSTDINLYRYCDNNPLNLVDPRGLEGGKRTGKTGHVSISNAYITGPPTIIISWHKKGDVDILFEYLDSLSNEEYEKLLQEHNKLLLELMLKIGFVHGGIGAAAITGGVYLFPYSPLGGGLLIAGGFVLEIKGVLEFADWAKRYGDILNQIKESQEEY